MIKMNMMMTLKDLYISENRKNSGICGFLPFFSIYLFFSQTYAVSSNIRTQGVPTKKKKEKRRTK